MTLDRFMIWRFKTIEGILANVKSWNVYECVFFDDKKIIYDFQKEDATIVFSATDRKTFKFKELTIEKLKELGFAERTEDRHESSRKPYNEGFNF